MALPTSGNSREKIINTQALLTPSEFRILLIDDHLDSIESTADLLKYFDYQVRTAIDATEGLNAAAEFQPHLILSDIGLPGMDGYQLAPALRAAAGSRKLILAAASGFGNASDQARALAAGFDHYLVKPIDAETLLKFVGQQMASY